MRLEHQLILVSAPNLSLISSQRSLTAGSLPKGEGLEEAELQAIDTLIPVIEDWNNLALLLIDRGTAR